MCKVLFKDMGRDCLLLYTCLHTCLYTCPFTQPYTCYTRDFILLDQGVEDKLLKGRATLEVAFALHDEKRGAKLFKPRLSHQVRRLCIEHQRSQAVRLIRPVRCALSGAFLEETFLSLHCIPDSIDLLACVLALRRRHRPADAT